MEICDWIINPFTANVNKTDIACQEELLEIRHDGESKTNFDSDGYVQLLRNHKIPNLYPNMWKIIHMLLITFSTLYLVQAYFSAVNKILIKKRNASKICE